MPTFMSTGAGALPPQAFATGSAVLNMLRQVGLAVGVAVFVAVIGAPKSAAASLSAWQHGWVVIAATSLVSALIGVVSLRRPRVASQPGRTPEEPVGASRVAGLLARD